MIDAVLDNDSKQPAPLNFRGFINDANHLFELIRVEFFPCQSYFACDAHVKSGRNSDYRNNTFCVSTELLFLCII